MDKLIWFLSSSVLILVVILLRALFGKRMSAGLRYALWGLVLLRMLIPGTVFHSAFSVASAAQRAEHTAPARSISAYLAEKEVYSGSIRDTEMSLDEAERKHDGHLHEIQGYSVESGRGNLHTYIFHDSLKNFGERVLLTVWKIGIAATALIFLISNLRLYFRLKRRRISINIESPLPVYSVDNLSSSCLFLRCIYVSAETAEEPEQLRHVLAHELAHHRHRDGLWALLRCAALALHWFNPLAWWAAILSRRDSELFADAAALQYLGDDERERYGRTLIGLSATAGKRASLLNAATTMTGSKKQLKERVQFIAKRQKATVGVIAAVCLIAVIAAGCTFTGAKKEHRDFSPTELDIEVYDPAANKTLCSTDLSVWDGDEELINKLYGVYTDLIGKAETVRNEDVPQSFDPPIYVLHFRDTELGEDQMMQMWSSGLFAFDVTADFEDHMASIYQAEEAEKYIELFESVCTVEQIPATASDLSIPDRGTPPDDDSIFTLITTLQNINHDIALYDDLCRVFLSRAAEISWPMLTDEQFNTAYDALKTAAVGEKQQSRDRDMMLVAAKTDGAYAELFFDPFPDALLTMQYEADPDAFLAALDELPKEISDRITPLLALIK